MINNPQPYCPKLTGPFGERSILASSSRSVTVKQGNTGGEHFSFLFFLILTWLFGLTESVIALPSSSLERKGDLSFKARHWERRMPPMTKDAGAKHDRSQSDRMGNIHYAVRIGIWLLMDSTTSAHARRDCSISNRFEVTAESVPRTNWSIQSVDGWRSMQLIFCGLYGRLENEGTVGIWMTREERWLTEASVVRLYFCLQ